MCILLVFLVSCEKQEKVDFQQYDGPLVESDSVHMFYIDSANLKMEMIAPHQAQFMNEDYEFDEGILIKFYGKNDVLENTLRSDYAYFHKDENLWHVTGDVQLKNIVQEKYLFTEELFWTPADQKVRTDKFVRIITPDLSLQGQGLEAKDDFSEYEIKNPTGEQEI